jgi:hypothetical protein
MGVIPAWTWGFYHKARSRIMLVRPQALALG